MIKNESYFILYEIWCGNLYPLSLSLCCCLKIRNEEKSEELYKSCTLILI